MKKLIFTFVITLFSSIVINAQYSGNPNCKPVPFQFSVISPIGTNGVNSNQCINQFSINLLMGTSCGVDGIELGSFINITTSEVKGIQMAGFGNFNGGNALGIQMAGFSNINGGYASGIQTAGFMNVNEESDNLIQLAGFLNFTGNSKGIQGAGFMNYARDVTGFQGAGFLNVASLTTGFQGAGFLNVSSTINGIQGAGFANYTRSIEGTQLAGFMNVAGYVKGIQLAGFLNICDSIDGVPIAFLSIVKKNGFRRFSLSANDAFLLNPEFSIGVKKFYTIFTMGAMSIGSDFPYSVGCGFGSLWNINSKMNVDIQALNHQLLYKNLWKDSYYDYTSLSQIKINYHYQLKDKFSVFAGPTFNILYSSNASQDFPTPAWSKTLLRRYDNIVKGWIGANVGIAYNIN